MGLSWNVTDTQVFDELALGLSQSVGKLDAIKDSVDHVFKKTIGHCQNAIDELKVEISKLEDDVYQLERERQALEGGGASVAYAHCDAEIKKKEARLRELSDDLCQIEKLQGDYVDTKNRYDTAFINKSDDYRDDVGKNCRLLNQFGIFLAQSRMG